MKAEVLDLLGRLLKCSGNHRCGCNHKPAIEIFLEPQLTPTFVKMCLMSSEARSSLQGQSHYTGFARGEGRIFTVAGKT